MQYLCQIKQKYIKFIHQKLLVQVALVFAYTNQISS